MSRATFPRRGPRRAPRAFGLLEVLISGTMLVIGLAAAAQFVSNSSSVQTHERHRVTAVHVAEQTMERLLVLFPDHADLAGGVHTGSTFNDLGEPGAGPYQVQWTVSAGDPMPGVRRVVVEVRWTENGTNRTLQLETIRT